jgi:hypothetical protein
MDMDFAVSGPLVRRLRLVPGSCPSTRTFAPRFLQTPPRGGSPCASLALHLHQVGRRTSTSRTSTSKLLNMPSTRRNRSRGNALRAILVQAHHDNGRNSLHWAIGGHPSVRCLIRLCTFDHEELSLEQTFLPRSCLRGRRAARISHAPWSAFIIGHFLPTTLSCYAAHVSLWNHKPSKMYFPLLTQDPCQQVMVVAISRREWFSREAPSQLSLCAGLRKLQDPLNS